jgi:hypothetical protein
VLWSKLKICILMFVVLSPLKKPKHQSSLGSGKCQSSRVQSTLQEKVTCTYLTQFLCDSAFLQGPPSNTHTHTHTHTHNTHTTHTPLPQDGWDEIWGCNGLPGVPAPTPVFPSTTLIQPTYAETQILTTGHLFQKISKTFWNRFAFKRKVGLWEVTTLWAT